MSASASMEEVAARLAKDFDLALLDQMIVAAYDPVNPNRSAANRALMKLQESPDLWTKADRIIEESSNPQTRFFGLQVLIEFIKTRWKIVPAEQREGIKNYAVGKIISMASDKASMQRDRVLIAKLNLILVEILKHEWPHNWPTFISDLVRSSKTSEVLCENNMQILKLLSEEVFDFSQDQMVTEKVKTMKESLNSEFQAIYHLCEFVLANSQRPSLLQVTLQTLQRFLTWIPFDFIFRTQLIDVLLHKFFPVPMFRNDALDCLAEIGSLREPKYDEGSRQLFTTLLQRLASVFSPVTNLERAFENGSEDVQVFIQRLALFFTNFFRSHLKLMETPESQQSLLTGLTYLLRISEVRDTDMFRICLETWCMLSEDLYKTECMSKNRVPNVLSLDDTSGTPRRLVYSPILTSVRTIMIERMAKPEEVLIVEDENGEIVRQTTKDTDAIAQYKTMRDTLVYLTHLNCEDTEMIMLKKLSAQVDGSNWSRNNLNTLCWAIGSISGAMSADDEKRLVVFIIKELLHLTERTRGKDNKAVCASCIMYVVGQYPRFLKAHWKFLKTVVNKLFEFMHEAHPGVQDMACDTFLKITNKCKRKFVTLQADEETPFICELVDNLPTIISDLTPHQIQVFYEAVGCMLSDRGAIFDRAALLGRLMDLPNRKWRTIMDRANTNVESLADEIVLKQITLFLKCNNRVCSSVGSLFIEQLQTFFLDMLNMYKVYSERISAAVAQQGAIATQMSLVRSMRSTKKEVLRLLITFIDKSGPPESGPEAVAQGFIPPVLDPILGDYQRNIAGARDPEVLKLFATVIQKLRHNMTSDVPKIMEAVFECTLQMITTNFEDFPEHRIQFFGFLKAVNSRTFAALFDIPLEHQKLVVDSVVWGMKHTERNISNMGLDILHELLTNVGKTPSMAQGFYRHFLLSLIQDVFAVMTDRLHKPGFRMHATLLRMMFHLVQTNQLPKFDTNPTVTNFVEGMFDTKMGLQSFKMHMRDFLIQLKEFSTEDNAGLFGEENETEAQKREESLRQQRQAVPGLFKPDEMADDDF